MDTLPAEVLPNIFKFLPLDDRKNVRLISRTWNVACNRPEIIAREKFVFRYSGGREDMDGNLGSYILNCSKSNLRPHFQFELLLLNASLSSSVWEYCGDQLKSLSILNCEMNDRTTSDIITYCSNLTSFSIHISKPLRQRIRVHRGRGMRMMMCAMSVEYSGETDICSENLLDDLILRKVERKNLLSLKMNVANLGSIGREWYRKLFQIYPNIHTLGVHGDMLRFLENDLYLAPAVQNFIVDDPVGFGGRVFNPNSPPILKELKMCIFLDDADDGGMDNFLNFLYHQTELEKLDLELTFADESTLKSLLSVILRTCLKLKEFVFRNNNGFEFKNADFEEFFNGISHMKSVYLDLTLYTASDNLLLVPTLDSKTTLEKLRISGCEETCCAILNKCSSLKHLRLQNVTIGMLQTVFRNHTKLKTLRLDFRDCKTSKFFDDGSSSQVREAKFSWNDLCGLGQIVMFKGLVELVLRGIDEPDDVDGLLLRCNFPGLKRFCLRWIQIRYTKKKLQKLFFSLDILSAKAPSLEYLELPICSMIDVSVDKLAESLNKWNRLRTVVFRTEFEKKIETKMKCPELYVEQLFIQCPSLRLVTTRPVYSYYYDRDLKTLRGYPFNRIFENIPCELRLPNRSRRNKESAEFKVEL